VTFFGIPVLAPATAGNSRIYRITNIRANATALSGGSAAGATPVIASISISGATSLLITNPTPTIGFVQAGLTASASSSTNLNQCTSATRASVNTLTFTENFGTAFKTRVFAQSNNAYAGQISNPVQNVPGSIYNSESNLVVPINGTQTAGLADYGTRLKASFNNIPTGVRLWVSTIGVQNNALPVSPNGTGAASFNVGQTSYVQLVSSETVSDGNAGVSGRYSVRFAASSSKVGIQIADHVRDHRPAGPDGAQLRFEHRLDIHHAIDQLRTARKVIFLSDGVRLQSCREVLGHVEPTARDVRVSPGALPELPSDAVGLEEAAHLRRVGDRLVGGTPASRGSVELGRRTEVA